MPVEQKITDKEVKKFKSDVVAACPSLVTMQEQRIARSIPDDIFEMAFNNVFNGDLQLARDVLYNRIDRLNYSEAEQEVESIFTVALAGQYLSEAIASGVPMLVISDVDGDGSIAQALAMEAKRITGRQMHVQSRDYDPANHGFSIKQINSWLIEESIDVTSHFTVLVADLGTNQKDTQQQFLDQYPQGRLIIADHHTPEIDVMVKPQHERSWLVSPFVKGSMRLAMKAGGGVSGGYLLYSVIKDSLTRLQNDKVPMPDGYSLGLDDIEFENRLKPMRELAKAANLIDNVKCDIRLKPLQEEDVEKALNISRLTGNGKPLGMWINPVQQVNIASLVDVIGAEGVAEFEMSRIKMLEQNHVARAIFDAIPYVVSNDEENKDVDIALLISVSMNSMPIEASRERNYVELLRPYIFNFNYENQIETGLKNRWLGLADRCMKEIGKVEKGIVEQLRKFSLMTELSEDYAIITRASSPAVNKVFSSKQLSKAYSSISKPVNMVVKSAVRDKIVLSVKSEDSFFEILSKAKETFPFMDIDFRGHANVGGLTLKGNNRIEPEKMLEYFLKFVNTEVKNIRDKKPLQKVLEVKAIHLPLVRELFQKMRVHIESSSAPLFIMKINENMVFEDKYSTEKLTVSKLVEGKPWEMTSEPLDFAMSSSLLIPNQALKAIANDGFKGALGITLMANGSYIADKVVTSAQIKALTIPSLIMPLEKEREDISNEYRLRFMGKDSPIVEVPRQAAINALKFTIDSKSVYENTESIILGVLNKTGASSYVVLDVEADGAGNAQGINVGLAIYQKTPNIGKTVSEAQFAQLIDKRPEAIRNYRKLPDGNIIFNQELSVKIASQIINQDGGMPIQVSLKVQNLTNMDQNMIDALGTTAEIAQKNLLEILKELGTFVIQAHNLPYDNNIMRINYPDIYALMEGAIHLDTAAPARDYQIAYTNLQVNTIDGDEYFNAEHEGYNLNTLLEKNVSFDYPSIKGKSVLQVRGDVVQKLNLKKRITTSIPMTRDELKQSLRPGMSTMRYPQYGIQKLLGMATITDMISHQPVKEINKVDFEGFKNLDLPTKLWDHFQERYAYDLSIGENVHKFMILPEVMELSKISFSIEDPKEVSALLSQARESGSGTKYDTSKKKKSLKDQSAQAEMFQTFTGEDILKANATNFVRANPENAERYALAWVYEMVLENHETTRKEVSPGFIKGISDKIGLLPEMVKKVYDEMYKYKQVRGIGSYMVHETHNNVGLEGDVFQEVNVFMHMLEKRVKNPYLQGKFALAAGIDPNAPMVDIICNQAASSTMRQIVRSVSDVVLDSDVLNNHSAKQLENFSSDGISLKNSRSGMAKMKCKSLSTSKSAVHIEMPDIDVSVYRAMPSSHRKELEERVELAVTTLLLSNSRADKSLDQTGRGLVTNLSSHPSLIDNLSFISEELGRLNPTRREFSIKEIMGDTIKAITGKTPFKNSTNSDLTPEDLDVALGALVKGINSLKEKQNFVSFVSPDEIREQFHRMKGEYVAMQEALETGVKVTSLAGFGPMSANSKRAQTMALTAQGNTLQVHVDACPELALGITNKKKDPLGFLLNSPLANKLMFSDKIQPANDLKIDGEELSGKLKRR
jgi:single-stranded DNA-specific DHH superfamily exonuclease